MFSTIQNYIYNQDFRPRAQKNFIQENVRKLKQLQIESKEKLKPKKDNSQNYGTKRKVVHRKGGGDADYFGMHRVPVTPETEMQCSLKKSQGCQTCNEVKDLLNDGTVILPRVKPVTPSPPCGMKDTSIQVNGVPNVPLKEDGKVDFVKLNAIIPLKPKKLPEKTDPTKPPPSYQRGVLPKYLKDTKKQHIEEVQKKGLVEILNDEENQEELIYLTEDEKKEHIKKMRKAYANLVAELNALPMKSNSFKSKKRKEEIEQALQCIEDGIKMFSRNKLYVKATT